MASQQTPTLLVVASAANIDFDGVIIDNCVLNGHPSIPIIATANWTAGSHVYDTSPIGVYYNTSRAKWEIYNQSKAPMAVGMAFNVLIAINIETGGSSTYSEQTGIYPFATATGNDWAPLSNLTNASELVFAIQDWGVGGNTTYINTPLGVYYSGGSWNVFREDKAAMPGGVSFSVFAITQTPSAINHQAGAGNIIGDGTQVNENFSGYYPGSNASSAAFVMPNWTYHSNQVYSAIPTGVYYTGGYWTIFNENSAPMTSGMGFNVAFF